MAKRQHAQTTDMDHATVTTGTQETASSVAAGDRSNSFVRLDVTLFREGMAPEGKLATVEFVFVKPPLEESMWGTFTVWKRNGKKAAGVRVAGPGRVWTDRQQQDHFVPFVRSSNPNEDGLPPSVRDVAIAAYDHALRVGDPNKGGIVSFHPPVTSPTTDPYVRLDMTLLTGDEGPEGKLAEVEFVFVEPPLERSMWGTFTVWQRRGKNGGVRVSGPGRVWTDNAQKEHFVPFVRSTNPNVDGLPPSVLHLVLARFDEASRAALAAR